MKNITDEKISTDLLFRTKDKVLIIGNVGFKLKNLWYYLSGKKGRLDGR